MKKTSKKLFLLNKSALEVFKLKGDQNAVKVRRVLQIAEDLSGGNMAGKKVLDLGCAEGAYSIELALRGAKVLGIDAREERMKFGRKIAQEKKIANLEFVQKDVREISKKTGSFDLVLFLGLLYHLDAKDIFDLLPKIFQICRHFLIIDTHISLVAKEFVSNKGKKYAGIRLREHGDNESQDKILPRPGASVGNLYSFRFTKNSLVKLLNDQGFTTVFECHSPLEPTKEKMLGDRITLVAIKGDKTKLSTYPWLNDISEKEIERKMGKIGQWQPYWESGAGKKEKFKLRAISYRLKNALNGLLSKFGYELRRK
ncbi:MAG TPA: class I SAM-dependent methyltransferase [bacterium]|jgi:SAM-dependent methyltransferase|nr:class I SAM-dependent methyltransferase [bacterium]